jgi:hypothetical protein
VFIVDSTFYTKERRNRGTLREKTKMITQKYILKWPKCLSGKIVLLLFLSLPSYSQQVESRKPSILKHRISVGPVFSFYKIDPHYGINTKAKVGMNACYKTEILLGRKTNVLLGLEYMNQALKFNGYYADTGYTYIFDESFAYTHEIRYNEVQLPVGLKLALTSEKDRPVTPYLFGGVGARYIFSSYIVVESDSSEVTPYDGKGTVGFEHELVTKNFNAFFFGGVGIQKNYRSTAKAIFLEFTFKRGFSRIHYSGYQNSNNVNIRESNLAITFGLRF